MPRIPGPRPTPSPAPSPWLTADDLFFQAMAGSRCVELEARDYHITQPVPFHRLKGKGMDITRIFTDSEDAGLVCHANVPDPSNKVVGVGLEDLTVISATPRSKGAGVVFDASPFWSHSAIVRGCSFHNQWIALHFKAAAAFKCLYSTFWGSHFCEILVENVINGDAGDGRIAFCDFCDPLKDKGKTPYGILQRSGGGLRVTNSKFLWYDTAIAVEMASNTPTGQFYCNHNSLEAYRKVGVSLQGDFNGAWVDHNQLSNNHADAMATLFNGPSIGSWSDNTVWGVGRSLVVRKGQHIKRENNQLFGVLEPEIA